MSYKLVVFLCTVVSYGFLHGSQLQQPEADSSTSNSPISKIDIVVGEATCPADYEHHRDIINDFFNSGTWNAERQELGINLGPPPLDHDDWIYPSDVDLLSSGNTYMKQKCQALNSKLSQVINEKNGSGEPVYRLSYYRASSQTYGPYYFAVGSLRQPSNPDEVAVGASFLIVYDSNLNKLAGYSF